MKTIRFLLVFTVIIFFLKGGISFLIEEVDTVEEPCLEYASHSESELMMRHGRSWVPFSLKDQCLDVAVKDQIYEQSRFLRQNMSLNPLESMGEYWGNVYREVIRMESATLFQLKDSLRQLAELQELTAYETAELIVTFVQDIPYSYVADESCDTYKDYDCIGYTNYGLLSPTEFIYTMKGDCDTRTTLLYMLLKDFGFDPMVLVSKQYRHAILAINLPSMGSYFEANGKRYFFWETTAPNWALGMLSPEMSNLDYWEVALN